jgi:hypothetical protein
MNQRIAFLTIFYMLALIYVALWITRPSEYINLYKYAAGTERSPFQQRILMLPLERGAIHSTLIAKLSVNRRGAFKDPANWPVVVIAILSLGASGIIATLLYRRVSPDRHLAFLVFPLLLIGELVTNPKGIYLYDPPSIALFSLGILLAYSRKWLWMLPLMVIATLNRETALLLASFPIFTFFSDGQMSIRRAIKPGAYCVSLIGIWLIVRWWVAVHYPGVGSELASNLLSNFKLLMYPENWPDLCSILGFLVPVLIFGWKRIDDHRFRWFLLIYPTWLVPMMIRGVVTEQRIYNELLPLTAVASLLIFEGWYKSIVDPLERLEFIEPVRGKRLGILVNSSFELTRAFREPLPEEELGLWEGEGE